MKKAEICKKSGRIFKQIRKQRNISISSLSEGIISPSSISKFEEGKTQLSFINLSQLLMRMHVNLDEFYCKTHTGQVDSYTSFLIRINYLYHSNDLPALKKIASEKISNFKTDKNFDNLIESSSICSLIKEIDSSFQVEIEIKKDLFNYLDKVEHWDFIEFSVFNNCMRIFDNEMIESALKEMLYLNLDNNPKNISRIVSTFSNAIDIFYRREDYQKAKLLLGQIEKIVDDQSDLINRFKQKFFDNLLSLNEQQAQKNNCFLIEFLRTVGSNSLASSYEKYIEEYSFQQN
ncbi:helix-turn-helix domain-containing protein [Oenococcus sp. UCMA 17063]|nr:helix-turn-helix domain-containing protein [Oenococcus sp. UCMA 17063]